MYNSIGIFCDEVFFPLEADGSYDTTTKETTLYIPEQTVVVDTSARPNDPFPNPTKKKEAAPKQGIITAYKTDEGFILACDSRSVVLDGSFLVDDYKKSMLMTS